MVRTAQQQEKLRQQHPDWQVYVADATDAEAVAGAIKSYVDAVGGMDAYVHAVGSVFLKPLHLTRIEEWHTVMQTNLHSAFYAAKAAIEPMRRQKSGAMLFFSSVAAVSGLANHEAIAAAKGGISALVRAIAATYASNGIRANAIAPGLVQTPATAMLTGSEQAKAISEKLHPLGRLGRAEEMAALAAWLISAEASWLTGQTISADGGMSAIVPKPRV